MNNTRAKLYSMRGGKAKRGRTWLEKDQSTINPKRSFMCDKCGAQLSAAELNDHYNDCIRETS